MRITEAIRAAAVQALQQALHTPETPCTVVDGYVRCNGHTIPLDDFLQPILAAAAPRFDGAVDAQTQLAVQHTFALGKRRFTEHDMLACARELYQAEVDNR